MKILEERGYKYQKHISTGGEGEIHLIKSVDKMFIAKVFPKMSNDAFHLLEDIGKLDIPNTPKIHEIFNYEDKTILIRDFVEGNTLYDEIRKNGYLTLKRSKEIILKICDALKALHNIKPNPVIHRDLKPENVIVMPDGDIRLIDFGIARYHKQGATRDTVIAGTMGYTAPEVMAGMQSDERSDVYAVGLLFYEMLTGKNVTEPPYQIRPVAETDALLPPWIDGVIQKATEMQQVNRYRNIVDFVYALDNPGKIKPKKRRWMIIAVVAAAVTALLAGGAMYFDIVGAQPNDYEMILELDFDSEEDILWILGQQVPDERIFIRDGQLHIMSGGCNIDYNPSPGMIVHYRASMPQYGALGMSYYRMNANVTFECLYCFKHEQPCDSTRDITLDGLTFQNAGQFVDIVFYVKLDESAVYAVAADEESGRICYTAWQIPERLKNTTMYMAIDHFDDKGSVIVESLYVAEGSLQAYLSDHLKSYKQHQKRVDALLEQDVADLPMITFQPMNAS